MEYVPYVILTILTLCVAAFLVYFYARKDTPLIAYAATFIGWFFACTLIVILPYDIYIVIRALRIGIDVERSHQRPRHSMERGVLGQLRHVLARSAHSH